MSIQQPVPMGMSTRDSMSAQQPLPMFFQTLQRHCSALGDDKYWLVDSLDNEELEASLRAASLVSHGGMLQKFRKSGREKPHRRFVRVTSSAAGRRPATLLWDKKSAPIVRADADVYESMLDSKGAPDVGPACFQVVLDKRMLFLVAETAEEKRMWVEGLNAVASRAMAQLHRDDVMLGAEDSWSEGSGSHQGGHLPPVLPTASGKTVPDLGGFGVPLGKKAPPPDLGSLGLPSKKPPPMLPGSSGGMSYGRERAPSQQEQALMQEEGRLRDQLANWSIQKDEERLRVYQDLQAKVDAEMSKQREVAAAEIARREAEEAAVAQAKYEQERQAWEAAEKVRVAAEATDALQQALLTQDAPTLRAALNAYGAILEEAGEPAVSDLRVARDYLAQLEETAQAFAQEYNEAVTELHQLTYLEVPQLEAEVALQRLQVAAERAAAAGALEDVMNAAQVKANALHASHVELLHAQSRAEATLLDAARITHTIGVSGIEPLRDALAHADALQLSGEVVTSARATLDSLYNAVNERKDATEALLFAIEKGRLTLATAVERSQVLRDFESAVELRQAIKRATASGVDQATVYEASHQLTPLEAAERSHKAQVQAASEALHKALAEDNEEALHNAVPGAMEIRQYIAAELFDTAERRMNEFASARELAKAKALLEKAMESAEGAEGAEPLRTAFQRAEAAGLQGLQLRRAKAKLDELTALEESAAREAEALAWMKKAEAEKKEAAERRRFEEEDKERDKEARRAKKSAEKEAKRRSEEQDGGGDFLAKAAAAQAWDTHEAPDGRKYYHNTVTSETTWEMPAELKEAELKRETASASIGGKANDEIDTLTSKKLKTFLRERDVDVPDDAADDELRHMAHASAHRPLVTWVRNKTADGRVYFFNRKTKETSWTRPDE